MPLTVNKMSAIELGINIDITYRFSKPVTKDIIKLLTQKLSKLEPIGNSKVSWYKDYIVVPSFLDIPSVIGNKYEIQAFDGMESTIGGLRISSSKDNIFSKILLLYDGMSSSHVSIASIKNKIAQHIKTSLLRVLIDLSSSIESYHIETVSDDTDITLGSNFKILGISRGNSSSFADSDSFYMVPEADVDIMERALHEVYYDWYSKDASEGYEYYGWIGMNVGKFLESDADYQHLPIAMLNILRDF